MRSNRTGGFTLIELLIVIAIIGILAAVLIPNLMQARRVAVDRAAQGLVQNVYTAGNAYMAENVQASAADVVALDNNCLTGGAQFGGYTTPAPSFDATSCTVADNSGDLRITLVYNGGVNSPNTITFP